MSEAAPETPAPEAPVEAAPEPAPEAAAPAPPPVPDPDAGQPEDEPQTAAGDPDEGNPPEAAGPDEAARAALELAHSQLLGENAPDQTEDPLRDFTEPTTQWVADTVRFVKEQAFNHLPHSYYPSYLEQLKAELDKL